MKIFINTLSRAKQIILIEHLRNIINYAPFFRPYFPIWNTPFRIQITNAGDWGWISDKNGYRYCKTHPKTNDKWPNIPEPFLNVKQSSMETLGLFLNRKFCHDPLYHKIQNKYENNHFQFEVELEL